MKNMLESIDLKFIKIPWVLRIVIYFIAVIALLIISELVLSVFKIESFLVLQLISFTMMSLSCIVVVKLFEKSSPLKRLGFEKGNVVAKYIKGYLIGTALIVFSALPIMLFFSESVELAKPIPFVSLIGYFIFFIFQGAGEEVWFRGLIFPIIVKKTSPIIAMLITSGGFAALHLLNPGVNLISVLNLFLAGIMFGYCVIYFDSLWQACALHSAWNFIQGNILGFKVSGIETPTLVNVTSKGNDIFTGADFGVEGSVFSVIVLIIAIVILQLGCVKKGIKMFSKNNI